MNPDVLKNEAQMPSNLAWLIVACIILTILSFANFGCFSYERNAPLITVDSQLNGNVVPVSIIP